MIRGAHYLLYSKDPEADRAFFRDVLAFPALDIGGGWLIFKLPPAEMAVHPSDGEFEQRHGEQKLQGSLLYLMRDDVNATMKSLEAKGVSCGEVETEDWGVATTVQLPSGAWIVRSSSRAKPRRWAAAMQISTKPVPGMST